MKQHIVGAVYDRVTGLPIEKAQIRSTESSCQSNADGEFQIVEDSSPILISKAGYCEREIADFSEKSTFYLMPDAPYAYVEKEGHTPGDTVELRVHSAKPYQVGLVNFKGESIPATNSQWPSCIQGGTDQSILLSGLDWKVTARMELPLGLKSDIYFISVVAEEMPTHFVPIVVEPSSFDGYPMIVTANTLTWHANNLFGGENKYHNIRQASSSNRNAQQSAVLKIKKGVKRLLGGTGKSTYKVQIPRKFNTNRPLLNVGNQPVHQFGSYQSHLIRAELNLFQWLNENGYRYAVVGDVNLAKDTLDTSGAHTLVFNTHCKYYPEELSERISSRNAHHVLNLGGNALHTKVRMEGNGLVSEVSLADSAISLGTELFHTSFDVTSYGKLSGYNVKNIKHQLFEGIQKNSIGTLSHLSNEKAVDGFSSERLDLGISDFKYALSGEGCAGWESDRLVSSEYKDSIIAQAGINGGADMVAYSQNGTKVFSASSVAFTSGILVDSDISLLVKNVLQWCGIHTEQSNLQHND